MARREAPSAVPAEDEMKPINVGLLGIGTVGGGTWDVLNRNADEIQRRAGRAIRITLVADKDVDAGEEDRQGQGQGHRRRASSVVAAPDIDIVVELIGGYHRRQGAGARGDPPRQARGHRQQGAARHARQRDLRRRAEEGRDGGVRGLGRRRRADHQGAARGPRRPTASSGSPASSTAPRTSSSRRCATRASPSSEALKDAQKRGYAEADPTFDIEGVDAAHKLTILSALAFGIPMQFKQGLPRGHLEADQGRHPLRRGARLPHQAAGHHQEDARRASSCACIRRWSRRGA